MEEFHFGSVKLANIVEIVVVNSDWLIQPKVVQDVFQGETLLYISVLYFYEICLLRRSKRCFTIKFFLITIIPKSKSFKAGDACSGISRESCKISTMPLKGLRAKFKIKMVVPIAHTSNSGPRYGFPK